MAGPGDAAVRRGRVAAVLVGLTAVLVAPADAESCAQLAKTLSAGWQRDVPCHCRADELARVKLALPKGLTLDAVCALRKADGTFVDLRRQSADLTRYDAAGNSYDGEFHLSGTLSMSGTIRVEPGNSGELWFTPAARLVDPRTPFGGQFQEFKIAAEKDYRKFGVTPALLERPCSWTRASVEFRGFRVSIGETDDTGAYPKNVRVLRVGRFKACPQR